MMMNQLHSRRAMPKPSLFVPVTNGDSCMGAKPDCGFWTSTYDPSIGGSAWIDWCVGNEYGLARSLDYGWLLTPAADARVLTIDSYADLQAVITAYPRQLRHVYRYEGYALMPDFERMAHDYDALHLTAAGERATRLSLPYNLYGWDCESTVWFRWAFQSVERIAITPVPAQAEA